jgi:hypothetical protein
VLYREANERRRRPHASLAHAGRSVAFNGLDADIQIGGV